MKLANRRIRLVLAVFAFAFAAMFLRAAWLQGVQAGSYERRAAGQHRATIVDPGWAGRDLRPHGRSARDRAPDDHGLRKPAPDSRPESDRGARCACPPARSGGGRAPARRPVAWLRLHRPESRPGARQDPQGSRHRRPELRQRGTTVLSPESRRGPGRRLRGHGQPRARGARARARRQARRQAGKRDGDSRPFGPRDQCHQLDRGARGPERHAHDRPHDPGPGRERSPQDDRPVARSVGLGGRARSAHRRRAGDGRRARLRRQPLPDRARGPATQPERDRHVRAGLDVQDRHGQRRPRRGARHTADGVHASRTRSTSQIA